MALQSVSSRSAGLAEVLTTRLAALTSQPELEEAWAEYGAVVETAREHDVRLLHRVEGALEHDLSDETGGGLFRIPSLVSERVRGDLEDAWARLRGRQLATTLRSAGPSLRAIAAEVAVSAPYLSQLASGAGPVPSRKILDKLETGLTKQRHGLPESPAPPTEFFESLGHRAQLLRERVREVGSQNASPRVTVEYSDQRVARQLTGQFELVAARSLDIDDGASVKQLLAALVEEDGSLLMTLIAVLHDEPLQKAIRVIAPLGDDVKRAALTLLGALSPPVEPLGRPQRDNKAPTPRKSEQGGAHD